MIFAYPTVAAMMGLAWIIPQGIELEANQGNLYSGEGFWLFVTACFIFIWLGFYAGETEIRRRSAKSAVVAREGFSERRLLYAAAGLTMIGLIAQYQMRGIDTSSMGGQWTGVITMWALLDKASGFGLCLAVLIFARTRSFAALLIAAVAAVPLINAAFFSVRRENLFDLAILTVGAWYLAKDKVPPRILVLSGLLVGTVILNNVEYIRSQILSDERSLVTVLTEKQTYESFSYTNLEQGNASEVRQAQFDFWYANQTSQWEYGAEYWNKLVHQYVPAFLLGREFKEGLKISTLSERLRSGEEVGLLSVGSTRTGFSDSYRAFGIFGVMVFCLIGYGFGILYAKSALGSLSGQYLYLILLAEGLKAITHSTGELLASLPFTLAISWLAVHYAKLPDKKRRLAVTRASARLREQP
ncbi:hypothetical protein [Altererythrobacter sp. GH1-8]|uniref:hypothetical protein n=1 Tax=Altererythrobacter sp. GH1-8 TaxID=3349333 RepID=UPI00374D71BE